MLFSRTRRDRRRLAYSSRKEHGSELQLCREQRSSLGGVPASGRYHCRDETLLALDVTRTWHGTILFAKKITSKSRSRASGWPMPMRERRAPAQLLPAANHRAKHSTSITSLTADLSPVRQLAPEQPVRNSGRMHGSERSSQLLCSTCARSPWQRLKRTPTGFRHAMSESWN